MALTGEDSSFCSSRAEPTISLTTDDSFPRRCSAYTQMPLYRSTFWALNVRRVMVMAL